ncbi:hypothetical protein Tco_0717115, partial [Tanacetum coccineum]
EIDDPSTFMEEYVQFETEKSLRNGQVYNWETGTDISKITRKPLKTGKHGHEKRKSTKEAKDSKPKPEKVKLQSKKVNPSKEKQGSTREAGFCTNCSHKRSTYVFITDCQAGNPCEFNCDPRAIINPPIIKRMYGHDLEERVEQAKG